MSGREQAHNGGLGFPGALFLVFLTLKLTGHIAWSWWWVTSPLWISAALVVTVMVVVAVAEARRVRKRAAARAAFYRAAGVRDDIRYS